MKKSLIIIVLFLCMFIIYDIVKADEVTIYWAVNGSNCNSSVDANSCKLIISNSSVTGNYKDGSFVQSENGTIISGTTWYDNNSSGSSKNYKKGIKYVELKNVIKPYSVDSWFDKMKKVTSLDLRFLDTSNVKNMSSMFSGSSLLETITINSRFDTSKVTNMEGMFSGCEKLKSIDLSTFDTSNVTSMLRMFSDCSSLQKLNLSTFNTSNVTEMLGMFQNCSNLEVIKVDDINFNVDNVTSSDLMFSGCTKLVGMDGTFYNQYYTSKKYAHLDSKSNPGYFSNTFDAPFAIVLDNNIELDANTSKTINYTLYPSYIKKDDITWTSSNEEILTVDENGTISAKKAGHVTVTATTSNGKTGTSEVTVRALGNIISHAYSYDNSKYYYLNDNGELFKGFTIVAYYTNDVKKIQSAYDQIYYLKNNGELHRIVSEKDNIVNNGIVDFVGDALSSSPSIYALSNSGEVYYYHGSSGTFNKLDISNIKKIYKTSREIYVFALGNDNVLYKINAADNKVERVYNNIKSFDNCFVLLENGDLYYDDVWNQKKSIFLLNGVDSIVEHEPWITNKSNSYYYVNYIKNNEIKTIGIEPRNNDIVYNSYKRITIYGDLSITIYMENGKLYYGSKLISSNVKTATKNFYITNDNKLYYYNNNENTLLLDNATELLLDDIKDFRIGVLTSDGSCYSVNNSSSVIKAVTGGRVNVDKIIFDTNKLTIRNIGDKEVFNYTVLPNNYNEPLSFRSNNEEIAIIEDNKYVKSISRGSTSISIISDSGKEVSLSVTALDPKVLSIITEKEIYDVDINDYYSGIAYSLETQDNPTYNVSFSSENPDVATVSESGIITPVSIGSTTVRITANGTYKDVTVNIGVMIKGISISPKVNHILKIGDTINFEAIFSPDNITEEKKVTWGSNNNLVVKIDSSGVATAVAPGKTKIYATTVRGITDYVDIYVYSNITTSISNGEFYNVPKEELFDRTISFQVLSNENYIVDEIKVLRESDNKDVTSYVDLTERYSSRTLKQYELKVPKYNISINAKTKYIKLNAPKLTIGNVNNNRVTLNWDKQEAEYYRVYYSNDGKKWDYYNEYSDTSSSWSYEYGKTYYYKIKAYNKYYGYSKASNIVKVKITPNKVVLSVKSAGSNNIKLGWEKVKVTGYEVWISTNNKKWSKEATIKKNGTLEYNDKKLKANKTYYYKVRAYKTVSGKKVYGKYSDVVSTTTAPKKPSLKVTLKDYNAMNVIIGETKGVSVYRLEKSLDDKTYTLVEELPSAGTLAQESQEVGKTYYFRVKVCNSENRCSGWVKANLKQTTKTPSLSLVTSSKKVTITLGSVNGSSGYEIYRSTKKSGKYTLVKELLEEDGIYTFENKTKKGTTYYYKVRSYKIVDGKKVYSPWSKIKSIKSK